MKKVGRLFSRTKQKNSLFLYVAVLIAQEKIVDVKIGNSK